MSQPTFEHIGLMRVHAPNVDPSIDVKVDGVPESIASQIDWGPIVDIGIAVGKRIFGSGGSTGTGPTNCVEITLKNPDGSTVSYKWCPPPKTP